VSTAPKDVRGPVGTSPLAKARSLSSEDGSGWSVMTPLTPEAPILSIVLDVTPTVLLVRLRGELDLSCVDLVTAVTTVESLEATTVLVDLAELTFCDSAGVDALLDLRAQKTARGCEVRLVNAQPLLRRLFLAVGEDHCLAA
jgi:anti-sigma B factor antagonist